MKALYAYVLKGSEDLKSVHDLAWRILEEKGHTVERYKFVFADNEVYDKKGSLLEPEDVLAQLRKADVFIGEMNKASQTLGFLLAVAVQLGKPSLYFYHGSSRGKPGVPLLRNPSRLLSIKAYDSDEELKEVLEEFLENSEKKLRSDRITFVSTREINDYLDRESKTKGLSKGEMIRGILEKSILESSKDDKGE